jgi:hypothetical protein
LSSNSPEEEEDAGEVHETENWDGPLLQMEQKFRPLARYLQSYLLTPVKHTAPYTQKSINLQEQQLKFTQKCLSFVPGKGGLLQVLELLFVSYFSASSNHCFDDIFHLNKKHTCIISLLTL